MFGCHDTSISGGILAIHCVKRTISKDYGQALKKPVQPPVNTTSFYIRKQSGRILPLARMALTTPYSNTLPLEKFLRDNFHCLFQKLPKRYQDYTRTNPPWTPFHIASSDIGTNRGISTHWEPLLKMYIPNASPIALIFRHDFPPSLLSRYLPYPGIPRHGTPVLCRDNGRYNAPMDAWVIPSPWRCQ